MKKVTERALRASIAHWKRMRDGKQKDGEKPEGEDCALCTRFCNTYDCIKKSGEKCPVYENTGKQGCVGTPYFAAYRAWMDYGIESEFFKLDAAEEVKYLESLLPK